MKRSNDGSKFMLFLMVWVIVFTVVVMSTLEMLSVFIPIDIDRFVSSPWFMIVYQLVIFILPMAVWIIVKDEPAKPNFPTSPLGGKNIILIVALSFLLQPFMMTLAGISSLFFTNDVAVLMYTFQRQSLWLQLLTIALTPAICEELVFRGYIQAKYRNHTIKQAALINGLFFAIMHLNLQQFLYTFVLGVIFAYMVHYTRSVWAGILPHFIINASQVKLSRVVFALEGPPAAEALGTLREQLQVVLAAGAWALVLLPVVVILFREFFKHNRGRFAGEDGTPEEKSSLFDPFTIGVIAMYVVFMAIITLAS